MKEEMQKNIDDLDKITEQLAHMFAIYKKCYNMGDWRESIIDFNIDEINLDRIENETHFRDVDAGSKVRVDYTFYIAVELGKHTIL